MLTNSGSLKIQFYCHVKSLPVASEQFQGRNAAIGLAPNSYHLMHHSSDKEFKITRKR
jgi:hypothetical protein